MIWLLFPRWDMLVRSLEGTNSHPKNWYLEEDPFPLSLSLSVRHWRTGRLGVDPVFFSSQGLYEQNFRG